ncbi:MAG: 30S ribosomal protein S8 [Candidatus Omnitrophica bacterium]|jgi:small subunit ribosomal protein S8|nr:30S ribosomal protein S8 [Candidatus Omnitrophota bacterium]
MTFTDPISDMMIRLKNAGMVKKEFVDIPYSSFKEQILNTLKEEKYIKKVETIEKDNKKFLRAFLLYNSEGKHLIFNIKNISTPGRRIYMPAKNIPGGKSDYVLAILSTSRGVCSSRKAKELGVGGEILFYIYK